MRICLRSEEKTPTLISAKTFLRRLIMNHLQKHFSASLIALAALLSAAPIGAWAATAPSLGSASTFGALGGAGVTCTKPNPAFPITVTGDVGSMLGSGSVTGFPGYTPGAFPCSLSGTVHAGDATANAAYTALFVGTSSTDSLLTAQACNYTFAGVTELSSLPPTDKNGVAVSQPLSPGVYCFDTAATLGGTLNLTVGGAYIFRTGTTLTTGATAPAMASVLVNGQASCGSGVFWQIGSSATIGSNTAMVGDILANQSISFTGVNTSLVGGAFANVASVTMTGTSITTCGAGGGNDNDGDGNDKDKDHHDKDHHDKDKDHKDDSHHSFKEGGSPFDMDEHGDKK
jgi:hypothetical protein